MNKIHYNKYIFDNKEINIIAKFQRISVLLKIINLLKMLTFNKKTTKT
jgi:hypothetical protein